MFDIVTTMIGVSFTVLALAAVIVGASIVLCLATLIKNLPKGVRAVRAAPESSLCVLAAYSHEMAEQMWFGRIQSFVGKYFLYGVCGIYISVAKFFACDKCRVFRTRADNKKVPHFDSAPHTVTGQGGSSPASAAFLKLSVVMKQ